MNTQELDKEKRNLLEKLRQKEFELSVIYDLTNNISYAFSYEDLLRLLSESLNRFIDYDLCATLIFMPDLGKYHITMNIARAVAPNVVEEAKKKVVNALGRLSGREIEAQEVILDLRGLPAGNTSDFNTRIKSSIDVPLFIADAPVGMMSISSLRDTVYSDAEIKLFYTLASQASIAFERVQAVLSVERSKMQAMVEGMNEGVVMYDEKNNLVVFNAVAKEHLGADLGRIGSLEDIKSGKARMKLKDIHLDEPYPKIIGAEAMRIESPDRRYLGCAVLLRDVTKEREIDRMKTDFISVVSHELRTPLTAIKGSIENLVDGIFGPLEANQQEALLVAQQNIDRLNRMISDLLDISRIESGKILLNKEPADIGLLIFSVIELLKASAAKKNIKFVPDVSAELPAVMIDSDKITQVITNILGNAIKFTPESGQINIKAYLTGSELRVEIKDSGIGIPKESLDKVFDKFYQVNLGAGTAKRGTGLGLPISKGIIEKHSGRIWAESELGKGSNFIFLLPVEDREKSGADI